MKRLIFSLLAFSIISIISCEDRLIGGSGADDNFPPSFFVSFYIEGTDQDLFSLESYSPDSTFQQGAAGDGIFGNPFRTPFSSSERTVFNMQVGVMAGGLGEPGTIGASTLFENNTRIFFSNGDIDTLYTVVRCTETCRYEDKIMQIYFNGKLIHDFDFRDKDSELLERLLDNNYEPYGDTVVFEIPKVPEF